MKKLLIITLAATSILIATIIFTSCSDKKKSETTEKEKGGTTASQQEKNKKTALESVNAMIAGDIDAALKNATPDAVDYGDGSMTPTKGIDSIKAALTAWRSALSEYKADNLWAIAEGDNVAVVGEWTGTFKTDFMGLPSKGKTFKVKDVDLFKFNSEGKITEHRNIQSSSSMISQLGVDSPK